MENFKERYKDLNVGQMYILHDNNTNIGIADTVNMSTDIADTFGDDNVYVKSLLGYVRITRSMRIKDGEVYKLVSKEPMLVFMGPVIDMAERISYADFKESCEDWSDFEKYMDSLGISLSPTDITGIFHFYNWHIKKGSFKLWDKFNNDIIYHPFNGNPMGVRSLMERRLFIITLLTGRPDIAYFVDMDDDYGQLKIHLKEDSFEVMSGDISLKDRFAQRYMEVIPDEL